MTTKLAANSTTPGRGKLPGSDLRPVIWTIFLSLHPFSAVLTPSQGLRWVDQFEPRKGRMDLPSRRQPQLLGGLWGPLPVLSLAGPCFWPRALRCRARVLLTGKAPRVCAEGSQGTWASGLRASRRWPPLAGPLRRCCFSSAGGQLSSWRCLPLCHSHSSSGPRLVSDAPSSAGSG